MLGRVVEAYIGEYASGKSENAVNRAMELNNRGRAVTLVDLDIVEPFYTLRPLKKELSARGIAVIAWETAKTIGLGETGTLIKPEARWALRRPGDIILDVGYGIGGSRTLNLLEGAGSDPDLQILAVINISRPLTASVEDIIEHVSQLGRVDGLINNTHLGAETRLSVVQEGARVVTAAARRLGLPVVATSVMAELAGAIGAQDCMGNPVRVITRYMQEALW